MVGEDDDERAYILYIIITIQPSRETCACAAAARDTASR